MTSNKLTGYDLSRRWFDFAFENPEMISTNHAAIYFFAIEHNNRLGWRNKFGYPSQMAMDATGIKKHSTYIRYFNDLVEWGFFKLIQKSQNQYSSNIISLNNDMPKNGKALDKAMLNHREKQTEAMGKSKRSIYKQLNNITTKQLNNIDYPVFLNVFNEKCNRMPKIRTITDKRKQMLKSILTEFTKKDMLEVVDRAGASNFLNGENEKGWSASFDWIFNKTNFTKILEGNYTNKNTSKIDPNKFFAKRYA